MADGSINFNTKFNTDGVDKGVNEISSKVLSLKNKIANTEAEAKRLQQELKDMANVPVDTSVGDKIAKDLEKAQEKLGKLEAEADSIRIDKKQFIPDGLSNDEADNLMDKMLGDDKSWQKKQEQIADLESQIRKYETELKNARATESQMTGSGTAQYREKEQKIQELNGKLEVYKVQLRETQQKEKASSSATKASTNTVKSLCNSLRTCASRLGAVAKSGLSLAKNGISKAVSGIKNLTNHTGKANSKMGLLGKTLKRIEKMIVGMIFYKIIRQGIQAIGDSLGTLSKESPLVNKQLSALMSSLTYLKNSLAAAFAPILNVVTPILTQFMDTLSNVINKVGNFIAVLTGQTSYNKAIKVQQDYAKSLDSTTSSTKKLNNENKKSLATFDELNVMQDNSTSDTDSSTSDSTNYFQSIPTVFDSFADKLKQAFKKGDYKAIGQLVADKINQGMKSIKWNKIRSTAKKWANNIGNFINGFVKKFNWKLLGSTIANCLNTISLSVKTLANKIDWNKLGKSISDSFNSFFTTFDWDMLGETLASLINIPIEFAYAFLKNIKWEKFGTAIHTALEKVFKNIDWSKAKDTLVIGINGLVSMAISLIGTPDFSTLGTNISQGIIDMLKSINWGDISTLFTTLVIGALDFVDGFLEIDWETAGNDLAESFDTFFGEGGDGQKILDKIGTTIGDLCDDLFKFVTGFFEKQTTADTLADSISILFNNVPWVKLFIDAFTAIVNVVSWLVELAVNLVDNFCKGLATGFDNAEDNDELMNSLTGLGKALGNLFITIIEGALRLIVNAIPNFILGLLKGIYNAICGIVGAFLGDDWYQQQTKDLWGANSLKFDFPVKIPRLATGTVVPASYGEFLAVLGDNSKEAEVVSPLSTMKQAFIEAMQEIGINSNSEQPITIQLDGEVVYKNVVKHNNKDKKRRGKSLLA